MYTLSIRVAYRTRFKEMTRERHSTSPLSELECFKQMKTIVDNLESDEIAEFKIVPIK